MCEANHHDNPEVRARHRLKPGTHCAVCGEEMGGAAYPGADVYHAACIREDTREAREYVQRKRKERKDVSCIVET
jgi:hypothetical protein